MDRALKYLLIRVPAMPDQSDHAIAQVLAIDQHEDDEDQHQASRGQRIENLGPVIAKRLQRRSARNDSHRQRVFDSGLRGRLTWNGGGGDRRALVAIARHDGLGGGRSSSRLRGRLTRSIDNFDFVLGPSPKSAMRTNTADFSRELGAILRQVGNECDRLVINEVSDQADRSHRDRYHQHRRDNARQPQSLQLMHHWREDERQQNRQGDGDQENAAKIKGGNDDADRGKHDKARAFWKIGMPSH